MTNGEPNRKLIEGAAEAKQFLNDRNLPLLVSKRRDFKWHRDIYEASIPGLAIRDWSEEAAVVRVALVAGWEPRRSGGEPNE